MAIVWNLCLILIGIIGFVNGSLLDSDPRIVGGQNVTTPIKFQVSIRTAPGTFHMCGGAILSENWVVTAGHCLVGAAVKIRVGSNIYSSGGRLYDIQKQYRHPKYNIQEFEYDIGLLKIGPTPIVFTNLVGPIKLPTRDIAINQQLTVTGWGATSHPNGNPPEMLQQLIVSPTDEKTCFYSTVKLCTFAKFGQGMCFGDSGSPIVNGDYLYGIVSAVVPCAVGSPDTNTRVFAMKVWLLCMTLYDNEVICSSYA